MGPILTELLVILGLLLLNGVFAMAEIAMVSARKARLRTHANSGERRAQVALELAENPNRFLSTVQIGITLIGILAGAFGGATMAEQLGEALGRIAPLKPYANGISLGVVVLAITYLSLVIGELVPKRLGLRNPEAAALRFSRPMHFLSRLAGPLVTFLGWSTDGVLRLLRVPPGSPVSVTEDEVKNLMQEGLRAGAFNQAESQMVERVLELDRLLVREIMTPRAKIIWVNKSDPPEAVWHKIVVSARSHFPVYDGNRDNVVGIISVKAVYANLAAGAGVRVADLMVPPLLVAATQSAIQLLDTLKRSGRHMALVADEYGGIIGLVTLHDVMEAIAGDFPSQDERSKPTAVKRPDGSWLIDAMIEIKRLESVLPGFTPGPEAGREYQTLAGYVLKQLQHVPREGETFETQGFVFEVLDMDRHRVDKVLVIPAPSRRAAPPPADRFEI